MNANKNILIACTGSVATIKLNTLVEKLQNLNENYKLNIKVIVTEHAKHFIDLSTISESLKIFDDDSEWSSWNVRGDPVLHIDLGKWADMLVIAPLSANSLAKLAMGICDNLVLSVVRAWDVNKPLLFCPAMNTRMFDHPLTREHITKLTSWGYTEVPPITKTLMCGDTGNGGMAEVDTIIENILQKL